VSIVTMNEHVKHSHGAIKKMAAKHREQLKKTTATLNDMITKLSQAHDNYYSCIIVNTCNAFFIWTV